jgi:YVTN family beta-propeller protein
MTGLKRPWLTGGALLTLSAALGCGNQYRPVINPVPPTGPAPQPAVNVVVLSQPGFDPAVQCPADPATAYGNEPGLVTIVNFSGDAIMAQAQIGFGPRAFAMDSAGSQAFIENCDGTLNTVPVSNSLQTKNVQSTTLLTGAVPTNVLAQGAAEYIVQQGRDAVAALTGSPPALKQEIPVAPVLMNLTGVTTGQRVFAISQGNSLGGGQPAVGDCATPSAVATNGELTSIETATFSVSARTPLGICPVYGFSTPDGRRSFILNRGSNNLTVINSQFNQIDALHPTIAVGAGPVFADYYGPSAMLVTANYDGNSITAIDVSTDVFGNDGPNFGKILATVTVGKNPASVTVLQDGSRAYVANEGDGTVSVINLSSFTVEKTITVPGHPRSVISTFNAPIGKVYVVAQDTPFLTVIRTDTDTLSTSLLVPGNIVDVHVTGQFAGTGGTSGNQLIDSRSSGSGVP